MPVIECLRARARLPACRWCSAGLAVCRDCGCPPGRPHWQALVTSARLAWCPRLQPSPTPRTRCADLQLPATEWVVGGTPLLSMMHLERRAGRWGGGTGHRAWGCDIGSTAPAHRTQKEPTVLPSCKLPAQDLFSHVWGLLPALPSPCCSFFLPCLPQGQTGDPQGAGGAGRRTDAGIHVPACLLGRLRLLPLPRPHPGAGQRRHSAGGARLPGGAWAALLSAALSTQSAPNMVSLPVCSSRGTPGRTLPPSRLGWR